MPTFIKTGFWEKAKKGYDHWLNLDEFIKNNGSGGIPEAPLTFLQYGRQNGEWTEINVPIIEAPGLEEVLTVSNTSSKAIRLNDRFGTSQLYLHGEGFSISPTDQTLGSFYVENYVDYTRFSRTKVGNTAIEFHIPSGVSGSHISYSLPKDKTGNGDFILATLDDIPSVFANVVYVNNITPASSTVFDLNNPPVLDDNTLKLNVNNLYIGSDSSTWVYNATSNLYVTKTIITPQSYQIEVGSSQNAQLIWNGNTIIFNTSCTINIPAGLPANYIFNGITLAGVTVTWNIAGPNTWLFGGPTPTAQKQIFTLTKRGSTNSFLLLGV